eukprot:7097047-Pyramimonas_sp.AAC.1
MWEGMGETGRTSHMARAHQVCLPTSRPLPLIASTRDETMCGDDWQQFQQRCRCFFQDTRSVL